MSKPPPPREDFQRTLSLRAIESNDCASVAPVTLFFGETERLDDTVRYQLLPDAAATYRFQPGIPVAGKDEHSKQYLSYLSIKRDGDDAVVVRLKKDAPAADPIELLLLLETRTRPGTNIAFDPVLNPGGGPRT